MHPKTVIGIDPGTREMGLVVLRGRALVWFGVRTLPNGKRHHEAIGLAKQLVLNLIEEHDPDAVAIEQPFDLPTKRSHLLNVIADELRDRSEELGIDVVELSPEAIRERVTGNPRANKVDVAEHLVDHGFGHLRQLVPKRPARAALGLRPRDKYWLHMFDALAIAVAASTTTALSLPLAR
ncbi:MAG: crossover junction endodeoxyribonuclease RuvC [Candidatus Eisenbacteria bacterium]|nr:crossover junction endodeoxyribonuclease RuvC [Candidatus Eisenbacteria bacterium]